MEKKNEEIFLENVCVLKIKHYLYITIKRQTKMKIYTQKQIKNGVLEGVASLTIFALVTVIIMTYVAPVIF